MAWVRFDRKFNWRVTGTKGVSFVSYPPGKFSVKAACAEAAVAAGAGVVIPTPSRKASAKAAAKTPTPAATDGAGA